MRSDASRRRILRRIKILSIPYLEVVVEVGIKNVIPTKKKSRTYYLASLSSHQSVTMPFRDSKKQETTEGDLFETTDMQYLQ